MNTTIRHPYFCLTFCGLFLAIALWFSSGTLSPYAATLPDVVVLNPCHYLANTDHHHFEITWNFLQGIKPETWSQSVVMRRILYPLWSYPWMKFFGFMAGGLVATILMYIAIMVLWWQFLSKKVGEVGARYGTLFLVTFPGITYYGGLPYCYSVIVFCSTASFMLLYKMEETSQVRSILLYAAVIGLLCLGYDVMPFLLPSFLYVMYFKLKGKRHLSTAILGTLFILFPSMLWALMLNYFWGISPINGNSGVYGVILQSYLGPITGGVSPLSWAQEVLYAPWIGLRVFFSSQFYFLTTAFLICLGLNAAPLALVGAQIRLRFPLKFSRSEQAFILTTTLLFLFNNLAPPYEGWQMRGVWIARLYMPLMAPLIFFISRKLQQLSVFEAQVFSKVHVLMGILLLLNLSVIFGPLLNLPWAGSVYLDFYRHGGAKSEVLKNNLIKYGKRPLGFCSTESKYHESK